MREARRLSARFLSRWVGAPSARLGTRKRSWPARQGGGSAAEHGELGGPEDFLL